MSVVNAFAADLDQAALNSGVALDAGVSAACALHFGLLLRWNKTHNLTRIVEPAEAARKHYLDCLVPLLMARSTGLEPASIVDVGSGAGFPGLFAALVWPKAQVTLWEPAQKRLSFLVLAAEAMGVRVSASPPLVTRAPSASPLSPANISAPAKDSASCFDLVLSRATFSEGKRGELLRAAKCEIAVWGHPQDAVTWQAEVATWGGWRASVRPYRVHGLEPRALLWVCRGSST